MLELPEVITISRQMQAELPGKRVQSVVCGASPHKFAFFNRPPEAYAEALTGGTVATVTEKAAYIVLPVGPDLALLFGDIGGRILFHRDATTLPPKHQLLLSFSDGSALTVSIVLWGAMQLAPQSDLDKHIHSLNRMSPLSPDFTFEAFERLLAGAEASAATSAKLFMISKPGLCGVGNGCLQDILWRARINPRRRVVDFAAAERRALYDATWETIRLMVEHGGRQSERDLYNRPGGYQCILDSQTVGKPCPRCGAAIVKIAYLGGAAYFCPTCQV